MKFTKNGLEDLFERFSYYYNQTLNTLFISNVMHRYYFISKAGQEAEVADKLKAEYRKRKLVEELTEKHYKLRNINLPLRMAHQGSRGKPGSNPPVVRKRVDYGFRPQASISNYIQLIWFIVN